MSADELARELESDPAFSARTAEGRRRSEEAQAEFEEASAPLIAALAEAGLPTAGFGDFRSERAIEAVGSAGPFDYERSVPVLLAWLPRIEHPRVREAIVRSLSTRHARPVAAKPLIEAFEQEHADDGLTWAIGSAIEVVGDDSVFADVARLSRERRHGKSREMLAAALGKMRDPRAATVLIELLDDEEIAGHAVLGLRRLAPPEAPARPRALPRAPAGMGEARGAPRDREDRPSPGLTHV